MRYSSENWKTASNDELRDFFAVAYNKFFVSWRDRAATATEAEWRDLMDEANAALEAAPHSDAAVMIMKALVYELEARWYAENKAAEDRRVPA